MRMLFEEFGSVRKGGHEVSTCKIFKASKEERKSPTKLLKYKVH